MDGGAGDDGSTSEDGETISVFEGAGGRIEDREERTEVNR